jgi:hypothetical protein
MTTYTQRSVNANGIAQIAAFLLENHKRGEIISQDPAMLRAWAADAEFSLSEGNRADIEIRAFDSVLCGTQIFTISADGLDSCDVEIDE